MPGHIPKRLCAVCRTSRAKADLIRLLRSAGGKITWPAAGPPVGKGLYICQSGDCLTRLFGEKRYRRQLVDSMDPECIHQLRAHVEDERPATAGRAD